MKQTMDKQEDRLLREALQRRADRVPALSDEFGEGVLERIRGRGGLPLTGEAQGQGDARLASTTKGGEGLRHGGWRTWTWVASVAAISIAIYIMVGGRGTSTMPPRAEDGNAYEVEMVAEAPEPVVEAPEPMAVKDLKDIKQRQEIAQPKPSTSATKAMASVASIPGRKEVKPREGQGEPAEVSGPVPTFADLQATLEQMEREALREADNMTMQALARVDAAQCPS